MKNYIITEEQIKELAKGNKKVKKMFPDVFETKLEIGKWYRYNGWLICFTGIKNDTYKVELLQGYGFDNEMRFRESGNFGSSPEYWVLANEEEVKSALIKEAERRGFKSGAKFKSTISDNGRIRSVFKYYSEDIFSFYFDINKITISTKEDEWDENCSNPYIFKDGIWAEVIKTKYLTKKQAEEELTKIQNDGYEYQIID